MPVWCVCGGLPVWGFGVGAAYAECVENAAPLRLSFWLAPFLAK
jgi:hypothetical protein